MTIRRRDLLKLAGFSASGVAAAAPRTVSADEGTTIARDVCIIGGGSAGTYAAVRLGDLGKSVIVIECQERLGGHAETFVDPASGTPIDIGVIVFENDPLVVAYLSRFGIPFVPASFGGGGTAYIDFTTGKLVPGYAPPPPEQFIPAIATYQQLLLQKFPYLDQGFQLPSPVPADLLIPFGAFAKKYGLEALVPTTFQFGQGIGDLLKNPALYALKLFSANVVGSLLGGGFFMVPSGSASLYDAAAAHLGSDVLYSSSVVRVDRSGRRGIRVWVNTPEGPRRIQCEKLVVACPPTLSNLAPLDLDQAEMAVFGRLGANQYATGVVRLTGVDPALTLQNTGKNSLYHLPELPGIYSLSPTGAPGLWNVKYGSPVPLPDFAVRAAIAADIRRIKRAGTVPVELQGFEIFRNHTPFEMMVSSAEIARGFYSVVNSLQGRRDTFYTGAAFQTNDSSLIWRFTEGLLPRIERG